MQLEVEVDFVPTMLKVLYGFAELAGTHQPAAQRLPDVALSTVLLLPTEELDVRTTETGAVWLVMRTGALHTAMALPDPRAAQLLGESLVRRATR